MLMGNLPGFCVSLWLNIGAAKLQYQQLEQLQTYDPMPMVDADENNSNNKTTTTTKPQSIVLVPQEQCLFTVIAFWILVLLYVGWFRTRTMLQQQRTLSIFWASSTMPACCCTTVHPCKLSPRSFANAAAPASTAPPCSSVGPIRVSGSCLGWCDRTGTLSSPTSLDCVWAWRRGFCVSFIPVTITTIIDINSTGFSANTTTIAAAATKRALQWNLRGWCRRRKRY